MAAFTGTNGNDSFFGTEFDDVLRGFGGNDTLGGNGGNDVIDPGASAAGGPDRIYGSAGNDTIVFTNTAGSSGYLQLTYFDQPAITATIRGPANVGSIVSSAGSDTLVDVATTLSSQDFVLIGGVNGDTFNVNGGSGSFIILLGERGNDTYNLTLSGSIRIGFDASWTAAANQALVVNLATGVVSNDGFGFVDQINITPDPANGYVEIYGTNFADRITGGSDVLEAYILASGNDTLNAGGGYDQLRYDNTNMTSAVTVDLASGTATGSWDGAAFTHTISGIERVRGTDDFGDTLRGGAADEDLYGYGGNDVLMGRDGEDELYGSIGNDTLIGGTGRDYLNGWDGNDRLDASQGGVSSEGIGDYILPGRGQDTIIGNEVLYRAGEGIDVYYVNFDGSGGVTITRGMDGSATVLSNTAGLVNDTITFAQTLGGTLEADLLIGQTTGAVDGNVALWVGDAGNDTIRGGIGLDMLVYSSDVDNGGTAAVSATFTGGGNGTATDGFGDTDTFSGIEGIYGTVFADTVQGAAEAEHFLGDDGNDRLVGNGGNDTLEGGFGADTLNGGAGDDFLFGYTVSPSVRDIYLGTTPEADLRDVIYGGDGNDSINGGYGNDELRGDAGNDTIDGGFGADTVIGGTGNDVLTGGALGDLMFGSDGNDFINGGFGFDRLNGGAGADKFFHLGIRDHGSDWIQDYSAADGDVLQFGGAANTSADDFLIQRASTATAGSAAVQEVFVTQISTGNLLWALVDGAAQTEINIQIGAQVFDLLA